MNCSVCNVELKMADRQGGESDYCPQCHDVWLDRGELDKIIKRPATLNFEEDGDYHRVREKFQGPRTALLSHREIGAVLAVLALLVILFMAREPFLALFDRREVARAWVQSFGALAPLAYIALYIGQIILPPLPGHFMGLMGGYFFGAGWGSLYSLIGVGLGAGLAMSIARHLGRPAILRLAGEQQLRDWERRLRIRSPLTWWLLFLFPVPDVIYYIAGLGGVPLHRLLIAALVGRAPALIVSNWLGAHAVNLPPLLFWGSWAFVAAVVVVIYRYQREVRWLALIALRYARRLVRKQISR